MPYIDIHTHQVSATSEVISVVNVFPPVGIKALHLPGVYSVGLHPWYIELETYKKQLIQVHDIANSDRVIAVGEIGLDKLRGPELKLQIEAFEKQIEISEELKRPVIVHNVKCFNELIDIRRGNRLQQPWILHGFTGSTQMMERAISEGCILSFGSSLHYSNSRSSRVLEMIPSDFFFLETDESDLSIEYIYERAAQLRKISLETLKDSIYNNYKQLFGDNILTE